VPEEFITNVMLSCLISAPAACFTYRARGALLVCGRNNGSRRLQEGASCHSVRVHTAFMPRFDEED
jgi:hypothetical protein